uniref:Peptidase M14 domain-containing protein n=1 Tax=Megaselia scalaris TaxID=36166 RepID=T1GPS0_MEGSC
MWLKLLSIVPLISASLALKGYQVIEIEPKFHDDFNEIENLQESYDFLKSSRTGKSQILVSPSESKLLQGTLENLNISYEIINKNILSDILQEKEDNDIFCVSARLGTDCYRSHSEINNYIEDLYQDIQTGHLSSKLGTPMNVVIFVDAGMHAREWISPATGIYVIQQLVENFEENQVFLKDFDWVVMPMINADGYEFTRSHPDNRMWRKNRQPYTEKCTGTDLNRNFDYQYGVSGTSSDPCVDTFKGSGPFSEPESVVLRDVLHSLKGRISFYLTLHSYGPQFLHPWSYAKVDAPTDAELSDVGRAGYEAVLDYSGRVYQYGNTAKLTYAAAGESSDYAYAVAGARISITMELPGGGKRGFDPPPKDIKEYVEESWAGIKAMAKRVIEKY